MTTQNNEETKGRPLGEVEAEMEMYRLALLKWNWICLNWDTRFCQVTNYNDMLKALPQLRPLQCHCSFCNIYRIYYQCEGCPLFKLWGITCFNAKSNFCRWAQEKMFGDVKQQLAETIAKDILKLAEDAGYHFTVKEIGA